MLADSLEGITPTEDFTQLCTLVQQGYEMNITDVKILLVNEERLKAYVSIVIDNCFVIKDLKIIQGPSGLFVAMPSKKLKDNTFKDIAHPLNKESRLVIENLIFTEYKKTLESVNKSLNQVTKEK